MVLTLGPNLSQVWERSTSQRRVRVVDSARNPFVSLSRTLTCRRERVSSRRKVSTIGLAPNRLMTFDKNLNISRCNIKTGAVQLVYAMKTSSRGRKRLPFAVPAFWALIQIICQATAMPFTQTHGTAGSQTQPGTQASDWAHPVTPG